MKRILILVLLLASLVYCFTQNIKSDTLFTASWNLENLFVIVNDTLKVDEEFLSGSIKEWTNERLEHTAITFRLSQSLL
jgi:hypothetical protein